MKNLLLTVLLLVTTTAFATCDLDNEYENQGWIVHNSSEFEQHLNKVQSIIEFGTLSGEIVEDLDGIIVTRRTHSGSAIYMKTISWDNLITNQDTMFGDLAIFSDNFNPGKFMEVRWFDGNKRHIVYNDKVLNCISIIPPMAVNTIF